MRKLPLFLSTLLALTCFANGQPQDLASSAMHPSDLPDAPSAIFAAQMQSSGEGTGQVGGTVLDIHGSAVAGAKVSLDQQAPASHAAEQRTTTSGTDGHFVFSALPEGRFRFTITSPGLETFLSAEIILKPGESREVPPISLPLSVANADVQVVVTQKELAQEQIKAEEKQRALGVFPNFYSSYIWNAAPLSSLQKFELAFKSITDPTEFAGAAVIAAVEQGRDIHPGFGQDAAGYAQRFGAAYADDAIARMIGSAVLPSLLHQDPRYFYKGSGTKRSRTLYAIEMAVLKRGDNGRLQPNYSHIGGAFASGAISNAYYPAGDRGIGLTIANGFINTAGNALDNLIREFALRRVTPGVPGYATGSPE